MPKTRVAGSKVTVSAAGTVNEISFDLALSCAGCHAPPLLPVPEVALEKVNVEPVGWPVEVNVPLNSVLPPMVTVVPLAKVQVAVQVTVAVVPLPVMLETMPPTYPVTT